MKVALVYDRINKWGGAERVLLALHKLFPSAPIYTSVYSKEKAPWAEVFDVKTSFLQKLKFAQGAHEFLAPLMPIAFESFTFDEYDIVISVTSEAAKGIITKPNTLHICLCLTPTRYLWSGYEEYFKSQLVKIISYPAIWFLRRWDVVAAQRNDYFIAISKEVQSRIKKYYKRDSNVIYPPLMLNSSLLARGPARKGNFFLVVSRLSRFVPYKRIDIAIEAANKLKIPLKIVGEGGEFYKRHAGETVEFLGKLTDEELSYYYKNCAALIFPGKEDFGLVMVEAQASGAPVIAYRSGGAVEIVQEGITGEFFDEQTVDSLVKRLEKFDPKRYNELLCMKNAQRFSFEVFKKKFLEFVEDAIS